MIAYKYTVFAIISTMLNLISQYISFLVYAGDGALYLAMFSGTSAGLVSKYVLDKKYIFYHIPIDKIDDMKKFILYSFMGLFTTFIFWITEIGFDLLLENSGAKYLGAIIGLSLGYIIKYFLDKKFVFRDSGL